MEVQVEKFLYPDIKSLYQCNKSDQVKLISPGLVWAKHSLVIPGEEEKPMR